MIPEVSPCGYPVDLLRSCYATDVRFYRDDPRTSRIRWYRVPADRPFLPVPTLFASSVYGQHNEFFQPVGEVGQGEQLMSDRPWVDGSDPTLTRWVEGHYCGTEAQWRGELYTPPRPRLVADCCGHGSTCGDFFDVGGPVYIVAPGYAAKATSIFSHDLGPIGLPPRFPMLLIPGAGGCTWTDQPFPVEFDRWVFSIRNIDRHHTALRLEYTRSPVGFSFVYELVLPLRGWNWYPATPVVLPLTLVAEPLWDLPATVTLFGRDILA